VAVLAGYNRYWSDPYDTPTQADKQTRNDYYSLTGLYDFGPFSVSLAWQRQEVRANEVPTLDVLTGGLMLPVGKDLARAVLVKRRVQGSDNDAWGFMVGYDHFFTAQTAVYVRAGVVVNQSDAGQTYAAIPLEERDDTPQDLAIGVYHHF
jgi:predicted porin